MTATETIVGYIIVIVVLLIAFREPISRFLENTEEFSQEETL